MTKVRQDAWSHEDDLLLAETVLRHIREGSTQLNAFEEVGDQLNRTSAACGFRWNAEVRANYIQAIEIAKRQRKELKRAQSRLPEKIDQERTVPVQHSTLILEESEMQQLSLNQVITYLQTLQKNYQNNDMDKERFVQLEAEHSKLKNEYDGLTIELRKTKERLATVEEDYRTFIQIMERARKLTLLDEPTNVNAPMFRMDKNGNLEQIAQNTSG